MKARKAGYDVLNIDRRDIFCFGGIQDSQYLGGRGFPSLRRGLGHQPLLGQIVEELSERFPRTILIHV